MLARATPSSLDSSHYLVGMLGGHRSRAVWPPRTPLTVALEESHTTNQGECGVHPLVRVRDALRAHDAATVEDTKTMLRELSFK